MKIKFLYFLALFIILSCKKEEQKSESYYKGDLTLVADESFKSVAIALTEGYKLNYPDVKSKVITKKEDLAFMDLLQDKAKVIIMSRELSKKEIDEYERVVDLKIQPAKFAADAVLFVVPEDDSKSVIDFEEIKKGMMSDEKTFIFDGTNSSNLNFVAQKIGKKPSELKFSILNGNESVIEELHKFPGKIGVISMNTFSRPYDKKSEELKKKVKILAVSENGKTFNPDFKNLKQMTYPFTRVLYFLTNEGNFGIANGFIRFSCTHIGQMIVQKEGLQKYYLYKREVQMN